MCFPSVCTSWFASISTYRINLSESHLRRALLLDLSFFLWFKPKTVLWLINREIRQSKDFGPSWKKHLLDCTNNTTLPSSLNIKSVSSVLGLDEVIWTVYFTFSSSDLVWEKLPVGRLCCRPKASWETVAFWVKKLHSSHPFSALAICSSSVEASWRHRLCGCG